MINQGAEGRFTQYFLRDEKVEIHFDTCDFIVKERKEGRKEIIFLDGRRHLSSSCSMKKMYGDF